MVFNLANLTAAETQYYLQHIVAPRPVCFASTTDKEGNVNLSPFSFFNVFSANPPIVIFSPCNRIRDNSIKHTLRNIMEAPEVAINIVTYDIVQQASLASCEYPANTDEFVKAGFTREPALMIRPPMVKESMAKLECRVLEIKSMGNNGGAGQLAICKALCIHINDEALDSNGKVDQEKLDLVARLGGDWYCRASPVSLFKVRKPDARCGMGIDALPEVIRNSPVLSGNHLGQLAGVHQLPEADKLFYDGRLTALCYYFKGEERMKRVHTYARELLDDGKVEKAWQILIFA